ncbi:NADPH-dependent diflavin oxidoreductase 1 [[Candida] railenensis]|uniref:NADPH-dependent diflavin oxidoreductase 1 n=1 Tax=[Candida] railenensis TaxID=45579 RepID=A0A9P0W095_9ASCO|nr:NADPH-dependent diflavin oxidoreductase 1 [[Candida] railenensis]
MITILYGSETGNAQDYAEFLTKRLRYYKLKPTVAALDDYPLKNLITETKVLIIVCSTTGQGELPRNSKKFLKFILKKKLPSDFLDHISLTTFGVGDSSYPQFNYAIKKIHTRLMQLGCKELCGRCEADEQSSEGIDGFYTEWETTVLKSLGVDVESEGSKEEVLSEPDNKVTIQEECEDVLVPDSVEFDRKGASLLKGTVKQNARITASDHFQDVRHIVIESDSDISYYPGDTISLFPVNDDNSVELLLQSQPHWIPLADKPLKISGSPKTEGGLTSNLTLRSLLKYHIDIMSIPRRSFFMTLWHFCDESTEDGEREKEKLKEFSSFEDVDELYNYANRPRRSILEAILEFQANLNIPVEYIFDLFPKIRPRLFSIASSNIKDTGTKNRRIELVVAVVEYKTMIRRIRRGLCTKWLKTKVAGSEIMFKINKSNLKFDLPSEDPPSPTTALPIIMVSPGTGIAPMRSLIEEKIASNSPQPLYLFFGCRNKEKDAFFNDVWEDLQEQKLLNYFPVYSREEEDAKCKYVQHKLIQQAKLVGELILNKRAIVFICGSNGSMPREVRITLVEILKKIGNLTEEEGTKYLADMERDKRYIQETW